MKKIMFNDIYGLTKAVLDGRKTQTRRIIKGKPLLPTDEIEVACIFGDEAQIIANGGKSLFAVKSPYKIGEEVAVAQAYNDFYSDEFNPTLFPSGAGWTNKMFSRADLMPHLIRITNARVERLQDISDDDCLAEGIYRYYYYTINRPTPDGYSFDGIDYHFPTPKEAFSNLINRISGKGTWESNPYAFAYDFELVK